jgi:hypothetical protein
METLIDILHRGGYSCVIRKGDDTRTYCQRGVADLWQLCHDEEHFLQGAHIADKVIGKGAAALMIYGGAREVYADVISRPALALLQEHGIEVSYREMTDRIVNRRGDGLCPVEMLCVDLTTIDEMVETISNFINKPK